MVNIYRVSILDQTTTSSSARASSPFLIILLAEAQMDKKEKNKEEPENLFHRIPTIILAYTPIATITIIIAIIMTFYIMTSINAVTIIKIPMIILRSEIGLTLPSPGLRVT